MVTAVVRVIVDKHGELSVERFAAGVTALRAQGWTVFAASGLLPEHRREVELVVEGSERDVTAEPYLSICEQAFGMAAEPGVVTYISRGTDEDALGVLARFGTRGEVERGHDGAFEFLRVRIPASEASRVPESRLHTAMEAALNCEVKIEFV